MILLRYRNIDPMLEQNIADFIAQQGLEQILIQRIIQRPESFVMTLGVEGGYIAGINYQRQDVSRYFGGIDSEAFNDDTRAIYGICGEESITGIWTARIDRLKGPKHKGYATGLLRACDLFLCSGIEPNACRLLNNRSSPPITWQHYLLMASQLLYSSWGYSLFTP
jgi:hypothetical protein